MAILVFSPNGTYVTKPTLEAARTSADCAGKTVVVTSALTAAQSNITAPWPVDRALEVKMGGSIGNTTDFTINSLFSAGSYQVFAGSGNILGLLRSEPEWFGVNTTPGYTDTTAMLQKAVNSLAIGGILDLANTKYQFTSITIVNGIQIKGKAHKHMGASPWPATTTGLQLSDLTKGTILYGTSLTIPALNMSCLTGTKGGISIEGIVFYQQHPAQYATITNYPYIISDESSLSGIWEGVTIKNCLFANANKGISLTQTMRFSISDINGDFFTRGFNFGRNTDVSRLERLHIWTYARADLADLWRQSVNSDYAIYSTGVDGLVMNDVFIWDRYKGIHVDGFGTSANHLIFDTVGIALDIVAPGALGGNFNDVQIVSLNKVTTDIGAIQVTGNAITTAASSLILNNISITTGTNPGYVGYNDAYRINVTGGGGNIVISNANVNCTLVNGINIVSAGMLAVNNLNFGNYAANQPPNAYTLATVGIRNESLTAALSLSNVTTSNKTLVNFFDGYSDNVTFEERNSLIDPRGSIANGVDVIGSGSILNGVRTKTMSGNSVADAWGGAQVALAKSSVSIPAGVYFIGAYYLVSTSITTNVPTDSRYLSFPRVGVDQNLLSFRVDATTGKRVSIQAIGSSGGELISGPQARSYQGVLNIYSVFMVAGNRLAIGVSSGKYAVAVIPAYPGSYFEQGDEYANIAPAVGSAKDWKCTVAGAPGTWVSTGNL